MPSATPRSHGNPRQAKDAGTLSHAHFSAVLDAATDAIIVIDAGGEMQVVNHAAVEMFGYERDQMVGANVSMLMPEPDSSAHDDYLRRYLATGENRIIGIGRKVQGLRRDGWRFPLSLAVGESTHTGERFFVGLLRDLTDQETLERRLRETLDQLAHSHRLSTLGEMAAGLAHELNQPLGAIANYAEACRILLKEPQKHVAKVEEILSKMSAQAQRAGDVIRRLRALAGGGESEATLTDLRSLVPEVVELARADLTHHGIELEVDLDPQPCPSRIDPIQIQQVVLNLVHNACESTVEANRLDEVVRVQTRRLPDEIEVCVCDRGTGLPEGVRDELLRPFVSTKSQGMGMGLAICDSIVSAHGGKLTFEDRSDGPGAAFRFRLPLARESDEDQGIPGGVDE